MGEQKEILDRKVTTLVFLDLFLNHYGLIINIAFFGILWERASFTSATASYIIKCDVEKMWVTKEMKKQEQIKKLYP